MLHQGGKIVTPVRLFVCQLNYAKKNYFLRKPGGRMEHGPKNNFYWNPDKDEVPWLYITLFNIVALFFFYIFSFTREQFMDLDEKKEDLTFLGEYLWVCAVFYLDQNICLVVFEKSCWQIHQ